MGVFDKLVDKVYKHHYSVELLVSQLHGGVPTTKEAAKGWIKGKMETKDEEIIDLVKRTMIERGLDPDVPLDTVQLDEIAGEVVKARHLSGFYRNPDNDELCIRGRHVKAMIKEGASVAFPNERWGPTRKGTKSYIAEHVFIPEDFIGLGTKIPDDIDQRFVSTWRGTGIQYDEVVEDATVEFTVKTDQLIPLTKWGVIWVTA